MGNICPWGRYRSRSAFCFPGFQPLCRLLQPRVSRARRITTLKSLIFAFFCPGGRFLFSRPHLFSQERRETHRVDADNCVNDYELISIFVVLFFCLSFLITDQTLTLESSLIRQKQVYSYFLLVSRARARDATVKHQLDETSINVYAGYIPVAGVMFYRQLRERTRKERTRKHWIDNALRAFYCRENNVVRHSARMLS